MSAAAPLLPDEPSAVVVDVIVESPLWQAEPGSEATVRRTIAAAVAAAPVQGEIAVLLTDDSAIRALNRDWRGFDKPTNVLSFPAVAGQLQGAAAPLGDVVIAYETLAAEAVAEAKPFQHHLAHLAVHGFLHLIGHDHENEAEAEAMEAQERAILERLGVPDPYRAGEIAE